MNLVMCLASAQGTEPEDSWHSLALEPTLSAAEAHRRGVN